MMIIELELGAILALQAFSLAWKLGEKPVAAVAAVAPPVAPASDLSSPAAPATHAGGEVEIVKRRGDEWVHVGHRHPGHADLKEALGHPDLAIRHADGRIEEHA
jgi:hypothetical protein